MRRPLAKLEETLVAAYTCAGCSMTLAATLAYGYQ